MSNISEMDMRELEGVCRKLEDDGLLDKLTDTTQSVRLDAYTRIQNILNIVFERSPHVEKTFPFFLHRIGETLGALQFTLSELELSGNIDVDEVAKLCNKAFEYISRMRQREESPDEIVQERDERHMVEMKDSLGKIVGFLPAGHRATPSIQAKYLEICEKNLSEAIGIYQEFFASGHKKDMDDYHEYARLLEEGGRIPEAFNLYVQSFEANKDWKSFQDMIRMGIPLKGEEMARNVFDTLRPKEFPFPFSFFRGSPNSRSEFPEVRWMVKYFERHTDDHPYYANYFINAQEYVQALLLGSESFFDSGGLEKLNLKDEKTHDFCILYLELLELQIFYLRDFTNVEDYLDFIEVLSHFEAGRIFLLEYFSSNPIIEPPQEKEKKELSEAKIQLCGRALSSMDEEIDDDEDADYESETVTGYLAHSMQRYILLSRYIATHAYFEEIRTEDRVELVNESSFPVPPVSDSPILFYPDAQVPGESQMLTDARFHEDTELSPARRVLNRLSQIAATRHSGQITQGEILEAQEQFVASQERYLDQVGIDVSEEYRDYISQIDEKYGVTIRQIIGHEARATGYTGSSVPLYCLGKPDLILFFFAERLIVGQGEEFIDQIDEIYQDHDLHFLSFPTELFFAEMLQGKNYYKEALMALLRSPESANNLNGALAIMRSVEYLLENPEDDEQNDILEALDMHAKKMHGLEDFETLLKSLYQSYVEELETYSNPSPEDQTDHKKNEIVSDLALSAYILGKFLERTDGEKAQSFYLEAKGHGNHEALIALAEIDLGDPDSDKENILTGLLEIEAATSYPLRRKLIACIIQSAGHLLEDPDIEVRELATNTLERYMKLARVESSSGVLSLALSGMIRHKKSRQMFYSFMSSVSDDAISELSPEEFDLLITAIQEDIYDPKGTLTHILGALYAKIRLAKVSERASTNQVWAEFWREIEKNITYFRSKQGKNEVIAFGRLIYTDPESTSQEADFIYTLHAIALDTEKDFLWYRKASQEGAKKDEGNDAYKTVVLAEIHSIEIFLRVFGMFPRSKKAEVSFDMSEGANSISVIQYWEQKYHEKMTMYAILDRGESPLDYTNFVSASAEKIIKH